MAYCHACGVQLVDGAAFCPSCGAPVAPASALSREHEPPRITTSMTPTAVVYAGFIRRWLALILDSLILGIPLAIIAAMVGLSQAGNGDDETANALAQGLYYLLYWLVAPFYYALQESSSAQATLGKRALGIKVTNLDGERIGFGKAIARWFASALSYLTLCIGFLMAAFTEKKQALHDFIVGTLVVDKYAYTDQPHLQKRELSGCLIAVVIAVFLFIPVTAILAAIALPAYQQYTVRSQVASGLAQAAALKPLVANHVAQTGQCPGNGSAGIARPEAYAGQYVQTMHVGTMQDDGKCAIQITYAETANGVIKGRRLWLVLNPDGNHWQCRSEIEDKNLPSQCRQ